MKFFLPILLAALLLPSAYAERVSGPAGKVYTYKEVDGVKREMEIYFPEGHEESKKPVPGIIFFHGGGWGGGTRDAFSYQCDYFASRGLVAATVTYRLATKAEKAKMKGDASAKSLCIPDAKSAIRWFKQHADELGVDPDRLIVSGGSAGGHICLIATNNPGLNDSQDPEGFDTSVAAYVLFNPALSEGDAKDPDIDFIQHVKGDMPPAIAFFGSEDGWLKGWNPTYEKWGALEGSRVDYQMADGVGHAFFNVQPWADLTLTAADRFLKELGFLKGKPTLPSPENGEKLVKQP